MRRVISTEAAATLNRFEEHKLMLTHKHKPPSLLPFPHLRQLARERTPFLLKRTTAAAAAVEKRRSEERRDERRGGSVVPTSTASATLLPLRGISCAS